MIIRAPNPSTTHLEKTYLSSYHDVGVTTLQVKNNDRFATTRRGLLGRMSDERAEIVDINTVASDKLSVGLSSATKFAHNSDDPLYLLDYDKIRFYRATSANGTYTLQTTVDIDVDNQDQETHWDDTGALTTHFYKISFYNSNTTAESEYSDAIQATGYDELAIGEIVDQVVRRVHDTSFTVLGFEEYLDIANEVGSDLLTQAQKPYGFLKDSVALGTTLNQNYIDVLTLVPTFWKFDYVEIATVTGNTSRYDEIIPLSIEQWNNRYHNTPITPQDNITDVAFDEQTKRLYIYPTPKTSIAAQVILHFYHKFTRFTSAGDLVQTPNGLLYRYKFMAEYYAARSETDRQWAALSEKYENKYGNEVVKMQRVNRLDVGTPRQFRPPRSPRRRRYHL